MLSYFTTEQREKLKAARIGIAGCGGLGSNVAMMLARSGIGAFVLIDGDRVERSNLNRQHFFPQHIGQSKVSALAEQLRELSPTIGLQSHALWLDESNLPNLLAQADIWIEALDDAATKAMFSLHALRAGKTLICGSGMGGFGGRQMTRRIMKRPRGLLVVVGDMQTDIAQCPPLAPRVTQCAAMQADAAIEYILTGIVEPLL
ncbi:MAG: sulfur carrier protein ThiS adenylyltransferase ThiF [Mailhella sp.]|nr:sulfur carrier protein ThiS adenylyltransferase ThiF [Mailhella sp.]